MKNRFFCKILTVFLFLTPFMFSSCFGFRAVDFGYGYGYGGGAGSRGGTTGVGTGTEGTENGGTATADSDAGSGKEEKPTRSPTNRRRRTNTDSSKDTAAQPGANSGQTTTNTATGTTAATTPAYSDKEITVFASNAFSSYTTLTFYPESHGKKRFVYRTVYNGKETVFEGTYSKYPLPETTLDIDFGDDSYNALCTETGKILYVPGLGSFERQ